jgi:hypothetical protein
MASSYGCFSRKPYQPSQVLYGHDSLTGQPIRVVIPNRLSPDCQYQKHDLYADPKCVGCSHKENHEKAH